MNVTVKRRRRKPMKPTRTPGKSALRRNPQDPAFGRVEQTRQHRPNRKHPQSPVLNLKLHEQLRITGPSKKQGLKRHSRITRPKPSRLRRKRIPILDCFVAVIESGAFSPSRVLSGNCMASVSDARRLTQRSGGDASDTGGKPKSELCRRKRVKRLHKNSCVPGFLIELFSVSQRRLRAKASR